MKIRREENLENKVEHGQNEKAKTEFHESVSGKPRGKNN